MIRFDAVKPVLDANETLFMARELEAIESKIYEFKEKELKYRELIPVSNRDSEGAESITYRMLSKVGMAKVISNYANDLPRADVKMEEFTQPVKTLGTSYGFSTQEVRAAIMNNVSLDTMKADAARRSIREKESDIAWNGDEVSGLKGLLGNPNIPIQSAANGIWPTETAANILLDVRNAVTKVRSQSKGIHEADTLLLPITQYNILAQTPRSTNSDMTILEYIQKPGNSFGLSLVTWLADDLENKFTGGTEDGAICYERSSDVLEQRIPMELKLLPVQPDGLEFIVPGESRHGGVVVRYPLGLVFLTGI